MTSKFLPLVAFLAAFVQPLVAGEAIEDFLGLKFGSDSATAKTAMETRGFKLKSDKVVDLLTFQEGIFSGQPVKELKLDFLRGKFFRATVAFEIHSGKREECARLGLEAFDAVRKALTEKYGTPATVSSVPRAKILAEKSPAGTALKATWRTQGGLTKTNRSITFATMSMALYTWVFNVTYEDAAVSAAPAQTAPRKDI